MENDLPSSNESLTDLLNSEYYLAKVLGHLLDDGLYECRLVCRKWYDVCSRLPVKLVNVSIRKLPIVVDRFPNAVALTLNSSRELSDEIAEAIQSLTRLRSLETIELHGVLKHIAVKDVVPFCNILGELLRSCHQSHSISFRRLFNAEAGMCLYSHLSHLTGLTRLHLPGEWEQLVNDSFTDVRNIEDLRIQSVCLEDGQLVFPNLNHLTRLSTDFDVEPAKKFRGGALQMILPYASSLQALEVCCGRAWTIDVNANWILFKEFRHLSSVEFVNFNFETSRDFCAAISYLNLTHLGFDSCLFSEITVENLASVRSLTSLRSFNFKSNFDNIHKVFHVMPQLTSLCMDSIDDFNSLTVFTALKTLKFCPGAKDISNLSHVFSCMPNLESLYMVCGRNLIFPSSCLSHLKKLRSLSLYGFDLDGDIFRTLAQLSGLTELSFCQCSLNLQSDQWSEINALTNLERLELQDCGRTADQRNALMEGKLLKLRYLSLTSDNNDEFDQWQILHQKLPSLRQCFVRNPLSGSIIYPEGYE